MGVNPRSARSIIPTMSSPFAIDAQLYLPISEQQLGPLLDGNVDFETALSTFEVPQLASLLLLHSLPALPLDQAARAEFLLSRAIDAANERTAEVGLVEFRRAMSCELDRARINAGYRLLDDYGIALLEHELVGWRTYLTETYQWNHEFCEGHRRRLRERLQPVVLPSGQDRLLTSEQSGVYRTVVAQSDDHLHVQGYAGTGKSLLIHALLELLQGGHRHILVLAERQSQLRALMAGAEKLAHVDGLTFGQLASRITPADLIDRGRRGRYIESDSQNPMYDEVMIRHLGIHPVGEFTAIDLVRLARRTVFSYCQTVAIEICEQHLPAELIDPVARQVVLHHATELWTATIAPASNEFRPPLREQHRIKLAALRGWKIPARYTHVVLDECHNLSKPVLQILDASAQAAISFGDEYQHLRGQAHSRARSIKRSTITHSVRSAKAIEAIVNPIIQTHPGETKEMFLGHRRYRAQVIYYSAPEIPDRPATILVQDRWELFDWSRRLASRGLSIRPLSSFANQGQWVEDCIELYLHGTRPRDGSLFRYQSWNQVRRAFESNPGFQRMDELLQRGYRREHWVRITDRVDPAATGGYALGLVADVRNLEFPEVMLAPNVIANLSNDDVGVRAPANALVYVAVTRAQHRLYVPQALRDWIEERKGGGRGVR